MYMYMFVTIMLYYDTFLGDRVVAISKYSSRRFDSQNQGRIDSPGLTELKAPNRESQVNTFTSQVPIHLHYNGFTIRPRS